MVRREDGERLAALAPEMLARDVERRVHSRLGRMEIDGDLSVWPMRGLSADRMAARRVALIGEAGHVFPPIGAQGFNLTMRDVASLATVVSGTADPGAHDVIARYGDSRRGDVASRTAMVDAMNRSLLSDFLPVQVARSAGFLALDRIPALRRLAMRQGLAPADQPFYPA
jgi:2-octaprenyl-6-methoxyphenol hydroxylase